MKLRDWFKRFKRVTYSPTCPSCETSVWTFYDEETDNFWCRKCGKKLFQNPKVKSRNSSILNETFIN